MFNSAVSGLSKVANSLAIASNALGTLVVLALVVVLNVDVIARGVYSAPLKGGIAARILHLSYASCRWESADPSQRGLKGV